MDAGVIKHAITTTNVDFDHEGTAVYILTCKCGWKSEAYTEAKLIDNYRVHRRES